MADTTNTPSLDQVDTDAVFLHGLLQGAAILFDTSQSPHPYGPDVDAGNATNALITEMIAKADKLSRDIGRLNDIQRRTIREMTAQVEAAE